MYPVGYLLNRVKLRSQVGSTQRNTPLGAAVKRSPEDAGSPEARRCVRLEEGRATILQSRGGGSMGWLSLTLCLNQHGEWGPVSAQDTPLFLPISCLAARTNPSHLCVLPTGGPAQQGRLRSPPFCLDQRMTNVGYWIPPPHESCLWFGVMAGDSPNIELG